MPEIPSGLVIGFHGCDKMVRDAIIGGSAPQISENPYDWFAKIIAGEKSVI